MNRRKFLKSGSIASISVSTLVAAAGQASAATNNDFSGEDYFFKDFDLEEVTIDGLNKKMASGEQTSVSITKMFLKRIQDIDKSGPSLQSVIEINPDAIFSNVG